MGVAQCIHQHQATLALNCPPCQVLVDGRPAPNMKKGAPVIIPYADNLNVCGTGQQAVQAPKDKVAQQLRSVGLRFHEEEDGAGARLRPG